VSEWVSEWVREYQSDQQTNWLMSSVENSKYVTWKVAHFAHLYYKIMNNLHNLHATHILWIQLPRPTCQLVTSMIALLPIVNATAVFWSFLRSFKLTFLTAIGIADPHYFRNNHEEFQFYSYTWLWTHSSKCIYVCLKQPSHIFTYFLLSLLMVNFLYKSISHVQKVEWV